MNEDAKSPSLFGNRDSSRCFRGRYPPPPEGSSSSGLLLLELSGMPLYIMVVCYEHEVEVEVEEGRW